MIQIYLILMTLICSMIFLFMNHPLAMGLMLLIQTLLTCMMTGLLSKTFWFSYILFLVFMGGLLVLFIYVTSLASNEMFSFSMNLLLYSLIFFFSMTLFFLFIDKSLINFFLNYEMINFNKMCVLPENTINLTKMYNFPTNLIMILLMNYLLITLIAVIKITNIFYGPLRKMN